MTFWIAIALAFLYFGPSWFFKALRVYVAYRIITWFIKVFFWGFILVCIASLLVGTDGVERVILGIFSGLAPRL